MVVSVEGDSHQLDSDDVTIVRRASGAFIVQEDGGFVVALDPEVTPELQREGHARELISRVQRMRKDAGFAVSDRIALTVAGGSELQAVLEAHGARIADDVLATKLDVLPWADERGDGPADHHLQQMQHAQRIDLDGITALVAITRIQ